MDEHQPVIQITNATEEDAPLVYEIMQAAFAEYRGVLNPPSGVYAETVEKTDGMLAPDRRWFASGIVQETERLRRVLDDVIDFPRIQQGERVDRLSTGALVAPGRGAPRRVEAAAELPTSAPVAGG